MTHDNGRPREPEPSFGPDEEGETPTAPATGAESHGAWVHIDEARSREEAERRRADREDV